jgi:hypothetical protein
LSDDDDEISIACICLSSQSHTDHCSGADRVGD